MAKNDEPENSIVNRLQALFTEIDQSDVSETSVPTSPLFSLSPRNSASWSISSATFISRFTFSTTSTPLSPPAIRVPSLLSPPLGGNLFFVREPGKDASEAVNLHAWTDGCAGFFSDCKELPVVGATEPLHPRKKSITWRSRTRRARSRCCAMSKR